LYPKSIGGDAFEWIEHSMQHVIRAVKCARSFDGEHVGRILYHTNRRLIPPIVDTDGTQTPGLGDVAATFAERQLGLHVLEGQRQSRHVFVGLSHEPKGDALG
jgi:hypothetical protein